MPYRPPIHRPIPADRPGRFNRRPKNDGFYQSDRWRQLRLAALARDSYLCVLGYPGCYGRASYVDHIIERKDGGADELFNLRSTCPGCHNKRHPEKGRMRDA